MPTKPDQRHHELLNNACKLRHDFLSSLERVWRIWSWGPAWLGVRLHLTDRHEVARKLTIRRYKDRVQSLQPAIKRCTCRCQEETYCDFTWRAPYSFRCILSSQCTDDIARKCFKRQVITCSKSDRIDGALSYSSGGTRCRNDFKHTFTNNIDQKRCRRVPTERACDLATD